MKITNKTTRKPVLFSDCVMGDVFVYGGLTCMCLGKSSVVTKDGLSINAVSLATGAALLFWGSQEVYLVDAELIIS